MYDHHPFLVLFGGIFNYLITANCFQLIYHRSARGLFVFFINVSIFIFKLFYTIHNNKIGRNNVYILFNLFMVQIANNKHRYLFGI